MPLFLRSCFDSRSSRANLNVNLCTCSNLKEWNCVLLRVFKHLRREENNEWLDIVFHVVFGNSAVISVSNNLLGLQIAHETRSNMQLCFRLSSIDLDVWILEILYGIRILFHNIAEETLLDREHFKSPALLTARIDRHIHFVIFLYSVHNMQCNYQFSGLNLCMFLKHK